MCIYMSMYTSLTVLYIRQDFCNYCNAVRRNVLAPTFFVAVVRVNATKFLSNLTLSSFSAGLDFGWGRGCMSPWWMKGHVRLLAFLVVRLCCKRSFRGGPGGTPPLKGGRRHNRPKLLHLHRSPPSTCYAKGNSGSSPLPFEAKVQYPTIAGQSRQRYIYIYNKSMYMQCICIDNMSWNYMCIYICLCIHL